MLNVDVKPCRVKLDINNLFRQIDDLLSKIEYLRQIATRAIELNDDVLIGLLLDLHVLKKEE